MQSERDETGRREQLLDEVVAAYLEASAPGQNADRKDWLTHYPELAADLQEFFASQDQLTNWTGPLVPAMRALGAVGSPSGGGGLALCGAGRSFRSLAQAPPPSARPLGRHRDCSHPFSFDAFPFAS